MNEFSTRVSKAGATLLSNPGSGGATLGTGLRADPPTDCRILRRRALPFHGSVVHVFDPSWLALRGLVGAERAALNSGIWLPVDGRAGGFSSLN